MDNTLVVGWLTTFVVILLGSLWAMAWGKVKDNGKRVDGLEKIVPVVQAQNKDIRIRLTRIEDKIDHNGRQR